MVWSFLSHSTLRVENVQKHVKNAHPESDRDLLHSFLEDSVKLAKVGLLNVSTSYCMLIKLCFVRILANIPQVQIIPRQRIAAVWKIMRLNCWYPTNKRTQLGWDTMFYGRLPITACMGMSILTLTKHIISAFHAFSPKLPAPQTLVLQPGCVKPATSVWPRRAYL